MNKKMKEIDIWVPLNLARVGHGTVYTNVDDIGVVNDIKRFYRTTISAPEQEVRISETAFDHIAKEITDNYPNNQVTVGNIIDSIREGLGLK